jgi:hypothetical protein
MDIIDILAWVGTVTSVVGIPLAIILSRRSRRRPILRFLMDFDVLLDPSDNLLDRGLHMSIGDRKIDSISRTRIALWNQQGDTISGSDIVEADPFRLQFSAGEAPLQARMLFISREQNDVAVSIVPDHSSVNISFDFVDAADGGVLEVVHQGVTRPEIKGTIRGSAVVSNGDTDLGPRQLLLRVPRSWTRRTLSNARRNVIAIACYVANLGIVAFALWKAFAPLVAAPGPIVSSNRYNLETRNGQVNFVNAVMNTNYYNQSSKSAFLIVILTLIAVGITFMCIIFYRNAKKRIPANIVSCRIAGGAAESAVMHPEAVGDD